MSEDSRDQDLAEVLDTLDSIDAETASARAGFRRSSRIWLAVTVTTMVAAQETDDSCALGKFRGREAEIEKLLMSAEVVSMEDIGMGVTKPVRVKLKNGDVKLEAAFKPIKRGRHKGFWESLRALATVHVPGRLPPGVELPARLPFRELLLATIEALGGRTRPLWIVTSSISSASKRAGFRPRKNTGPRVSCLICRKRVRAASNATPYTCCRMVCR